MLRTSNKNDPLEEDSKSISELIGGVGSWSENDVIMKTMTHGNNIIIIPSETIGLVELRHPVLHPSASCVNYHLCIYKHYQ